MKIHRLVLRLNVKYYDPFLSLKKIYLTRIIIEKSSICMHEDNFNLNFKLIFILLKTI